MIRTISLGILLLAALRVEAAPRCVPLNSTVVLFDEADAIHCPTQIDAAAALGNRKVNILFTAHFVANTEEKIDHFCIRNDENVCVPVNEEVLTRMHGHWEKCVAAAVKRGLELSVYIQIDDTGVQNIWRNNLKFDPLQKYSGYSYDDVMTKPIAEIVARLSAPTTRVEFGSQGEMGATLAFYPVSNLKLLNLIRQRLRTRLKNFEVGVNVNFSAALGMATKLSPALLPDVRRLFDSADFIGVSAYHEVMIPVEADNFRFGFDMVRDELKALGVELRPGTRWRISETGMGGGNLTDTGSIPAKTVQELAMSLWSGLRGPYQIQLDPFQKPEMGDFRRSFYREMLTFLKQPPEDIPLESAYLWNSDSWDVQGLYPYTRGWQDPQIVEAIRRHNAGCRK